MTNNELCSLLCIIGIITISISMGLMFFGNMTAIVAVFIGAVISTLGSVNFD